MGSMAVHETEGAVRVTDIEKVIKALEQCRDGKHSCDGCPYNIKSARCIFLLHSDALELLKEQPQIVRCKDCNYYDHCEINDLMLNHENGFCADGERKR